MILTVTYVRDILNWKASISICIYTGSRSSTDQLSLAPFFGTCAVATAKVNRNRLFQLPLSNVSFFLDFQFQLFIAPLRDSSQNLHGMLFSNGDDHRGLKAFVGVPKMGAHFMPKTVNWPFKAEGGLRTKIFIE